MMQLWGITSNMHKWEAEAQGGVLPGAQLLSVQPQPHASAFPSTREGREAVGALHYQSEQSFPTGVLLTELGSVSAPKLMFWKHRPEDSLHNQHSALWKTSLGQSGENEPEHMG